MSKVPQLEGGGARFVSRWPGLSPGPRHLPKELYCSQGQPFVDFGPVVSPGFTKGVRNDDMEQLYKAVCPGVELLNLSGPASPWLSMSNDLARHFFPGLYLVHIRYRTGGSFKMSAGPGSSVRFPFINTQSRASQAQTPSPLRGLHLPTPHLPALEISILVNLARPRAGEQPPSPASSPSIN